MLSASEGMFFSAREGNVHCPISRAEISRWDQSLNPLDAAGCELSGESNHIGIVVINNN